MDRVYLLQHSHSPSPDNDQVKVIGCYRTRSAAEAAVARLRDKPGFREHPEIIADDAGSDDGFHISEHLLDRDSWVEGYVSWADASEDR